MEDCATDLDLVVAVEDGEQGPTIVVEWVPRLSIREWLELDVGETLMWSLALSHDWSCFLELEPVTQAVFRLLSFVILTLAFVAQRLLLCNLWILFLMCLDRIPCQLSRVFQPVFAIGIS